MGSAVLHAFFLTKTSVVDIFLSTPISNLVQINFLRLYLVIQSLTTESNYYLSHD